MVNQKKVNQNDLSSNAPWLAHGKVVWMVISSDPSGPWTASETLWAQFLLVEGE